MKPRHAPPAFPEALDGDDDDVAWALQTGGAQWNRGAHDEALIWLRRAIEAARSGGRPLRARDLEHRGRTLQVALEVGWVPGRRSQPPRAPLPPPPPPPRVRADSARAANVATRKPTDARVPSKPPEQQIEEITLEDELIEEVEELIEFEEDEIVLLPSDAPVVNDAAGSDVPPTLEDGPGLGSTLPPYSEATPEFLDEETTEREIDHEAISRASPSLPRSARRPLPTEVDAAEERPDSVAPREGVFQLEPESTLVAHGVTSNEMREDPEPTLVTDFVPTPTGTSELPDAPISVETTQLSRLSDAPMTEPAPAGPSERAPADFAELVAALSSDLAPPIPTELPPPVPSEPAPAVPSDAPASLPPAQLEGIALSSVPGLQDLPDEAQRQLARTATLHSLGRDEEISGFGLALIVDGTVAVMPTIADVAAAVVRRGEPVFSQGHLEDGVPMRVVAGPQGARVASWRPSELDDALRDFPWVGDELKLVADRFQALVGVSMGPLGESLDDALRSLVVGRCEVRQLLPGELIAEQGKPIDGMYLLGGGQLETFREDQVLSQLALGEFLFPSEILQAAPARSSARAGPTGALVLFAPRFTAHELMVSVPPLLEIFAR